MKREPIPEGWITLAEWCRHHYLSQKQALRYCREPVAGGSGMPHRQLTTNRVIVPDAEATTWYHRYLVEKGRREATPVDIDDLKQRREAALTEVAEMDLLDRRRETMLTPQYRSALGDAFARVRGKILNLPSRCAGAAFGATSLQDCEAKIKPIVAEVMEELRQADDVPEPDEET